MCLFAARGEVTFPQGPGMIPAAILLVILIAVDAGSHVAMWVQFSVFKRGVLKDLTARIEMLERSGAKKSD